MNADFGRRGSHGGRLSTAEPAVSDRARISRSISLLSTEQQAVLHRCFYWRWTTSRTAVDLGITESAVKSRLHEALWTLLIYSANDAVIR